MSTSHPKDQYCFSAIIAEGAYVFLTSDESFGGEFVDCNLKILKLGEHIRASAIIFLTNSTMFQDSDDKDVGNNREAKRW